ncbi:MAG: hypothetical protein H7323_08360, partial [Frankiales bacterium]|nr:hypothetical protein [Frankiales bacterium]
MLTTAGIPNAPQHLLHAVAAGRRFSISVAGASIPVLAATDLATWLMLYDRARDLADLEELLSLGAVDVEEVSPWLTHLVGADDPRLTRL